MGNKKKLTPKESAFIANYIDCLNAAEAARRAGYSEKTARYIGHENLTKPHIKNEIARLMRDKAMQPDEILYRLSRQARADMGDLLHPGYSLGWIDLERARELGITHLIKEFKRDKDGGVTVKLYDAQAALVHLAKIHAMFTERLIVEDWHSQAIADIRAGRIDYEPLAKAFDDDLATQLFREAGVPVPTEQSAVTESDD